jgi:hypothetical protein
MTLNTILSNIFPREILSILKDNYLYTEFDDNSSIFENEIVTWYSEVESKYPIIASRVVFISPDYNQTEFYQMAEKVKQNLISNEEITQMIKKELEKEQRFLDAVVKVLTTLLNSKGDIRSILPEIADAGKWNLNFWKLGIINGAYSKLNVMFRFKISQRRMWRVRGI